MNDNREAFEALAKKLQTGLELDWNGQDYEGYSSAVAWNIFQAAISHAADKDDYITCTNCNCIIELNKQNSASMVEQITRLLRVVDAAKALDPLTDRLICYASTMSEYEPNRIVEEFKQAVAAAQQEKL